MPASVVAREVAAALDSIQRGEASLQLAGERSLRNLITLKSADENEPWAEDDAQLPIIEALTIRSVLGLWRRLRSRLLEILGLGSSMPEAFAFDPQRLAEIVSAGEQYTTTVAAPSGPLTNGQVAAWSRGGRNAAAQLRLEWNSDAVQQAIARQLARVREAYAQRGLSLVRGGVARTYRERIVAPLAAGEFDGQNPLIIARQLRQRFDAGNYNWERLARSEVAQAQSIGKRDLMLSQGVEFYDFVTASVGACPICIGLAADGPYRVADPSAPIPVRDTHPACRCTTTPRPPE